MKSKFYLSSIFVFLLLNSCKEAGNDTSKNFKNANSMKEEKSFFITDVKNARHEVFRITPEIVEKMKIEGKMSFCDSVYEKYNLNAFKLEDGKVIVQESNKYALYPSIDVLLDVLKGYTGPHKKEFLDGRNPFGKNFPVEVDHIISKMLRDFGINLDMSKRDILKKLDSVIVKNRDNDFLDRNLLGFIALIGKYNIEEFGGKWEMELADDRRTWNPSILINNQKVYFVSYIWEDFLDYRVNNPATEVFETVGDVIRYNIFGSRL